MKKFAFYTLGCKLNFAESSSIARSLEPMGFTRVDFQDSPNLFVINTCSVTEQADKKCKKVVREAKKINPDSTVVIMGCYAQLKPEEIASIPGVDLVLGANEKFQLPDLILPYLNKKNTKLPKLLASEIRYDLDYHSSYSVNDRTRTFLKVQDGCDYPCSYCTIPLARGQSRSDSVESVLALIEEIALKGIKEIRTQIQTVQKKTKDTSFQKQSNTILASLKTIEEALHQTKAKSGQDVLNFPIRLDDKIAGVFESAASGYTAPTQQVQGVYELLKGQVDAEFNKLETLKKTGVKKLNDAVHQLAIPIIGG